MMKNKYSKWLLVVVICMGVAIGGYWNYSSIAIGGTSDNGMWKANYKKNSDETVGGWIGHLQQKSGGKVKIKEVSFTDNGKIVVEHKGFTEGKSEDGSVTKLNPLSTDFYLGDPPKKEHVYKLHITWEKKGQPMTDTFLLK
ncbi:hypothetical protein [Peribacillus frigoritolerans]|uniref:hypothetical protein n=1 Tax=Peribacillus frigoritolerans TaxID=450367 RepID=UPI002282677F|nr:hypothetical protein [Peribacillus frigoritolerans]MCY9002615.1 hypothetical protein [Peribacillus frigoritolerans]